MITNPNTLGLFDAADRADRRMVHEAGGLVYLDGANMNAILGITPARRLRRRHDALQPAQDVQRPARRRRSRRRPDRRGRDAGPVPARRRSWSTTATAITAWTTTARSRSAGVRSFFGNVGVLVRAYCYIRTHGPDGLRRVAENAVLNANYLLSRVQALPARAARRPLHARVRRSPGSKLKADRGISAMDIAKRLLDYGFHAPTVYFPLIVREAMMIEPTETESKETLDAFAEALFRITGEPADLLHEAPHSTSSAVPTKCRRPQTCPEMEPEPLKGPATLVHRP